MKVYDISSPIFEGMPVYKDKKEKQPKLTTVTNGYVTETRLEIDAHTGTHVDAPLHMIVNGETIETISIEKLVGQCKVFDLTGVNDKVTKEDLERFEIQRDDFIILKTKNSFDEEFNFDFIYLEESGARYLAEIGIRGVGIDTLGIERSQEGHPTHKTLFTNNVIIVEGLRLKEIPEGQYFMVISPLKLAGIDGAPARALLFEGLKEE
ncbi:cyclase family protein [Anaerobacillus alkaliphilus]|uniref:Kynurenine formamidase n=1 Tax=Anaerobacillus alkaliphilus TaxID=1548597 RepID=A0A4Q0VQY8_9BACI|nr:cyclase family protein [Anaerobacillus alkaliphilus]RXI97780.1 cyclase family protein [Anaerobacillus alkaliphilus]